MTQPSHRQTACRWPLWPPGDRVRAGLVAAGLLVSVGCQPAPVPTTPRVTPAPPGVFVDRFEHDPPRPLAAPGSAADLSIPASAPAANAPAGGAAGPTARNTSMAEASNPDAPTGGAFMSNPSTAIKPGESADGMAVERADPADIAIPGFSAGTAAGSPGGAAGGSVSKPSATAGSGSTVTSARTVIDPEPLAANLYLAAFNAAGRPSIALIIPDATGWESAGAVVGLYDVTDAFAQVLGNAVGATLVLPPQSTAGLSDAQRDSLSVGRLVTGSELAATAGADIAIVVQPMAGEASAAGTQIELLADGYKSGTIEPLCRSVMYIPPPHSPEQTERFALAFARAVRDQITAAWTAPAKVNQPELSR